MSTSNGVTMKKVYFPTIPLQEMVKRPGGMTREQALEAANANVLAISGEGDNTIEGAIQALEAIIAKPASGGLSQQQLRVILSQGDQIVTLAGTFGYDALDRATRSLCDVADGLLHAQMGDVAPVAVHVRAMRLFSPLCAAPGAEESGRILGELAKVTAHYNFAPLEAAP